MVLRHGGVKMNFPFKITHQAGLYQFLHVKANPDHRTIKDSNLQLQVYLSLARRLSLGLNCYALLPYSPDVAALWPAHIPISFRYQVLNDDFNGLGVDKGFERLTDGSPLMLLLTLKDVMTLRSIPEDCLGDHASIVTLFLLHTGRESALKELLQSAENPDIAAFLKRNELFLHLICGKEVGYFDAMLIRSTSDITTQIKGAVQLTQTTGL